MAKRTIDPGPIRPANNRVLYFDPEVGGHHPIHILSLLLYWNRYSQDELVVILHPDFPDIHKVIWDEIQDLDLIGVEIHFISQEQIKDVSHGSLIWKGFQLWKLLDKYASLYCASTCYVNYLDIMLLPFALQSRLSGKQSISGIIFRPTLHYHLFENHQKSSGKTWLRRFQKRLLFRLAVLNPALGRVFSLDPYAVSAIQNILKTHKAIYLPEPFLSPESDPPYKLWNQLNVSPDRKKILLFGVLSRRKGILKILRAVQLLSLEDQNQISLLFIGRIAHEVREEFLRLVDDVRSGTSVDIHIEDNFVSNQDAWRLFLETDLVLAIYERSFVGSSGLLIWAAYAQKPVLATSYGMIGQLVRDRNLGITIDPENPQSIRTGIMEYLRDSDQIMDTRILQEFALENTSENYAKTIIQALSELHG